MIDFEQTNPFSTVISKTKEKDSKAEMFKQSSRCRTPDSKYQEMRYSSFAFQPQYQIKLRLFYGMMYICCLMMIRYDDVECTASLDQPFYSTLLAFVIGRCCVGSNLAHSSDYEGCLLLDLVRVEGYQLGSFCFVMNNLLLNRCYHYDYWMWSKAPNHHKTVYPCSSTSLR